MNDRRRPRVPAKPKPAPQLTGPVQLDDETRNALILFNARLVAQEELEREKRRIDKATKAKDEAAANVRRVEGDAKATAEQKNEAQAAYLAALDALDRAKAGEPVAGDATGGDDDASHDAATATEEVAADDATDATEEVAADDAATAKEEVASHDATDATEEPAPDDEPAAEQRATDAEPASAEQIDATSDSI